MYMYICHIRLKLILTESDLHMSEAFLSANNFVT